MDAIMKVADQLKDPAHDITQVAVRNAAEWARQTVKGTTPLLTSYPHEDDDYSNLTGPRIITG